MNMYLYLKQIKLAFISEFIYRGNTLMTITANLINFYISIAIWRALYEGETEVAGIPFNEVVTFIIINLFINGLIGNTIARDIAARIRNGSIERYFTKPLGLKYYMLAEKLGKNLFSTLFSVLPVTIVAIIFFQEIIINFQFVLIFLVSLIFSIVQMFYIDYTLSLFSFWLKSGLHINFFT